MPAAIVGCAAVALTFGTYVLCLDGTEVRRVGRTFYSDVLKERQGKSPRYLSGQLEHAVRTAESYERACAASTSSQDCPYELSPVPTSD